jgi:GTP-binding protein
MIKIKDAKFITSAPSIKEALANNLNEVAIMGRSNVGKSSFINSLTNRKNLAKSSSTPGKTRLINFFDITFLKDEKEFFARVVDLPGFGYAKVSKSKKKQWQKALTEFITHRSSIRVFIHLLDARHPNLKIDKDVREYLKSIKRADQEIIEIFTKADKLNQKEKSKLIREFSDALFVSNLKKSGIDKAREAIFRSLFGELV